MNKPCRTFAAHDSAAETYLTVSEVASILNVSDDTVARQFQSRAGVVDLGSPETLHRRRKRVLRISRGALDTYLSERQVKVRQ